MRLLISTLVVFLSGFAFAHNNLFLPGDSFFSSDLTVEKVEEIEKTKAKEISLNYQRLDYRHMACGYLGYANLKITDVSDAFRENLLTAYKFMRGKELVMYADQGRGGKKDLREANPVSVLVYNKGGVKFPLGLKFNEDWQEEGQGVHGGFVKTYEMMIMEAKHSKAAPALKLEEKLDSKAHIPNGNKAHKPVYEPLHLKSKNAAVVLAGFVKTDHFVFSECLNLIGLAKEEEYCYYMIVDDAGVKYVELGQYGEEVEYMINKEGRAVKVEEKKE